MRNKVFFYIVFILVILLLQTSLVDYIKILGVKPNIILIFVVAVSLLKGHIEGAVIGCITGFALDTISGGLFGFYALLFLYTGLFVGYINKRFYKENFLVMFFIMFSVSVAFNFIIHLLTSMVSGTGFVQALTKRILPEALYNSVVSVPLYLFIYKMLTWLEENRKSSRKY